MNEISSHQSELSILVGLCWWSQEYGVFRVQDYSWKEQGYSLVSRFYEDAAPLLDDEFDHIYTMTDHRHVILTFLAPSPPPSS